MACAVAVRDMAAAVNTVSGVGVLVTIKKVGVTAGVWAVAAAVATIGGSVGLALPVAVGVGVDDSVAVELGTGDGVAVEVGIGDGVAVKVGIGDGVAVGVKVGTGVDVGISMTREASICLLS